MADYTAQVQHGIATLNAYQDGVTEEIDLGLLDISHDSFCAASQAVSMALYGEPVMMFYSEALGMLEVDEVYAVALGFELPFEFRQTFTPADLSDEYGKLTAAWHTALLARREG